MWTGLSALWMYFQGFRPEEAFLFLQTTFVSTPPMMLVIFVVGLVTCAVVYNRQLRKLERLQLELSVSQNKVVENTTAISILERTIAELSTLVALLRPNRLISLEK